MTDISASLTTADGRPLKAALAAAQGRARRKAFFLVAPLLLFVVITFILPIGQMLQRSVYHDGFSKAAPNLAAWFEANASDVAPDEAAFAALAADLAQMKADKTAGEAGTRINYTVPGTRSLFTSAARGADKLTPPFKEALLAQDAKWGQPIIWQAMRAAASPYTTDFYLIATDRARADDGSIVQVPENERIYLWLFGKTFILSGLITFICLLLAFPIAHLLATLPMAKSNLLMILVLLPFWTSLLVRTTSWIVLLQGQGVVNNVLVSLGVVGDDGRLSMIYNQTGTIIVMTHILLPFMVLPLYSVMRTIKPAYARAARSLGATSWTTFRRIYLPQTLPGIGAGALLVFILAVGYYITPALVGGASGQLISNLIDFHMDKSNWSLAAALSAMLLAGVLVLYWLYDRLVGIDKLKLG
ncbi:ABC transporter permease [Gemmobacter fulvus]|uniref:ABC transporter permease n=1 Tax=Gemmobacter fulvus TaxID=2840474 RepID=A0A975P7L6_9RHOB|nr:ABC transporter permease [Gemmobacter fulvus]MBT9245384.1 ABC transporter permease [Gemmobacter fulvus]QWK90301.1 ABC transporter permease [Gemmobacter fulvus]